MRQFREGSLDKKGRVDKKRRVDKKKGWTIKEGCTLHKNIKPMRKSDLAIKETIITVFLYHEYALMMLRITIMVMMMTDKEQ